MRGVHKVGLFPRLSEYFLPTYWTFQTHRGVRITEKVASEELETMGLWGNVSDITEKKLSKEHGVLPRQAYQQ
jgi:hypothetical protein